MYPLIKQHRKLTGISSGVPGIRCDILIKMSFRKIVFYVLLCLLPLIFSGCLNQKLWYQFLNFSVDIVPERFQFEKDDKTLLIPMVASHALDQMNHHTRHLIIAIHGGGRSLSTGLNKGLPSVSSFEVIDRLIKHSIKMHPGIKQIFIIGHSAGGQFVMRYAAVNSVHDILEEQGIAVRYISANPSSYLYLTEVRYQFASDGSIERVTPDRIDGCPEYNSYRYGLKNFYGYAQEMSKKTIQNRLFARPIIFLLGTKDNERDWSLDKSCPGELQGENRYQRGVFYKYHLYQAAGNNQPCQHTWIEIPEAGHDAAQMLTHPIFIEKLQAILNLSSNS